MSTFTSTTTGIYLYNPAKNPATIVAGAFVTNTTAAFSGDAVFGDAATAWNVTNLGTITATGAASGVVLEAGGAVTNAATASISGGFAGVEIFGSVAGTVTNSGTIRGIGTGTSGLGIYLQAGGVIVNGATNATSAVIAGRNDGVSIYGGAGTVSNFGTITGTSGNGIFLKVGGSVGNAGLIEGYRGLEISNSGGTVSNSGTIKGTGPGPNSEGVFLVTGGSVGNASHGLIAGYFGVALEAGTDTVANYGTIQGTGTDSAGIFVSAGAAGTVSNASGGLILSAFDGISLRGNAGAVSNSGTIQGAGSNGSGVYLAASGGAITNTQSGLISGAFGVVVRAGTGTVSNSGTIEGTGTQGDGVYVAAGGGAAITNARGALIAGGRYGVEIAGTAASTVTNLGTIASTGSENLALQVYPEGIDLTGLGAVFNGATNATSALITGYVNGVFIDGSSDTVTNFGTIEGAGTASDGIHLRSGGTVANAAGAVVRGSVNGVEIDTNLGTVSNLGTIESTGTGGAGVALFAGGSVLNQPGGLITGVLDGVFIGSDLYGHYIGPGGGTVSNVGTIEGTGTDGAGVYLIAGGVVTNNSTGVIRGSSFGVRITSAGAVTNLGNVAATATNGVGIYLTLGTVTNAGTVIAGADGIGIDVYGGQVTNTGTIIAPAAAAVIVRHGTFINEGVVKGSVFGIEFGVTGTGTGSGKLTASGTVSGTIGIGAAPGITAGYTVTVGGTVMSSLGSGGTAVSLGGLTGRLIVDRGAAFTGIVDGGGGSSVLEISASGSGTGGTGGAVGAAGTIAYVTLGSVVNFSLLQVDPSATVAASGVLSIPTLVNQGQVNIGSGDDFAFASVSAATTGLIDLRTGGTVTFSGTVANQTLEFNPAGGKALIAEAGEFGATITGFTVGDTIDLTGFAAASRTFANNALVLTDTVSNHVTLDIQGSFTTSSFAIASDGGSGTDITAVACFCRGTRVRSGAGEVAVEDLAIGDRVVTLAGAARPVKWIGRRSYDPRFVAGNPAVLPIRITAGALAEGVPARDLWLSPEHALLVDGMLVPAGLLANGATIHQVERVERVEYFHIELDGHDVIFAEGAAAETYVDCDNRLMFQNGAEYAALYPDARPAPWQFCAPRVEPGSPGLTAIRAALLARAEGFGHRLDLDPDPDLHLIVDGRTIWPHSIAGERHRFRLPSGSRAVWLASRSAVPAEVETAGSRDRRRLGVPLARIALFDAERSIEAGHGDAALSDGFHADEGSQRWTNGRARLPDAWLRAFPGGAVLDVHLVPTGLAYRLPPPALAEAAA